MDNETKNFMPVENPGREETSLKKEAGG